MKLSSPLTHFVLLRISVSRLLLSVVLAFSLGVKVFGDVRLPAIFDDHMVLQQRMGVPVWGWANPGESVVVSGSWGKESSAIADDEGRWKLNLATPSHGGPYIVTIQGWNRVVLENVMIGEVWLCAGQSNMGWRLSATSDGVEDSATADFPGIRIFRSERAHSPRPREDVVAKWKVCTPESAALCSAVTFYFARKLHQELGIPVGVVLQPYAGTPIEGWMPKDVQLSDPRTRKVIEELDTESDNYDVEKARQQLARATELWKSGKRAGEPKLRTPSNWGHQYPGNIFNGMIHPVRPYGIRGAIWYQGERNAKDLAQAANYANQLPLLIDYYRSSWNELSKGSVARDFPFYFVQLPSWLQDQSEPVETDAAWAVSREMMRLVSDSVKNTGVAVSVDTGDSILLHPVDKKPIGLRLAYLALKETYGQDFVAYGPRYRSHEIRGDQFMITFDSIGSGMKAGRKGKLDAFAIAGEDKAFVWADAKIIGNQVVVSADEVRSPVAVRYAWAMNPSKRNLLYNEEGIPASPFRTDDWLLFDEASYVPSVQDKPKKPEGYKQVATKRPPPTQ